MSNTDQAPEPSMEEILSSIRRIISDDNDPASAAEEVAVAEPEVEETPADVAPVEEAPVEEMAEPDPDWGLEEAETETAEEVPEPEPEPSTEEDDDIFELTNIVEAEETTPEEDKVDTAGFDVEPTDEGAEVADSGADVEDDIEFVEVETEEPEVMALPELGPEPVLEIETPVIETPVEADASDRLVSEGAGVATAASFGDLANTLLSRGNNATTVEELVQEMLRPLLKNWLDDNLPAMVEKLVSEEIERIARRGR